MTDFFRTRLAEHQKQQLKYLRLVFNDQFVIALFFLVGAIGYAYSNGLKLITKPLWWAKPALLIVFVILLMVGQLASLMKNADSTFLLPKQEDFNGYLLRARRYSLILPAVWLVLMTFALMPFMGAGAHLKLADIVIFGLTLLILKDSQLWLQFRQLYHNRQPKKRLNLTYFYLLALVIFAFGLWYSSTLSLVFALILDAYLRFYLNSYLRENVLNWQFAIEKESNRMFQIYRFYNLFTDVPGMQSKIRRRKYADGLLNQIKQTHSNTYLFLFARTFVRENAYFGMYWRLVIFGIIVLYFVPLFWLNLVIMVLVIYLVEFQLIPLFHQYDEQVFTYLYPVSKQQKGKSFQQLITFLLALEWVLLMIPVVIQFKFSTQTLIALAISLVEVIFLVRFFAKRQLKK